MKIPYFFTIIVLGLSAVSVQAQITNAPINTVPEGITTFQLPFTGQGSTSACYFSAPLVNDPIYTGAVSGVTAVGGTAMNTISVGDNPQPWSQTTLGVSPPYFVKFLSPASGHDNAETGRVLQVLSNTAASLTLDISDNTSQSVPLNTANFDVQAGDTFEVFAGDTLATMFGLNTAQSPLVIRGGAITADSVSIYSPQQNRLLAYFFNTTVGYWEKIGGGTANCNNVVIRPYSGFIVTRNGSAASELASSFVLTGRVAEVSHVIKTTGNDVASYDSTGYPVDVTLAKLNLSSNWVKAKIPTPPLQPSPIGVDTIAVYNTTGLNRFDYYFEVADSTWRKVGGGTTDQSNFVIPAATTVCFIKYAPANGTNSFLTPAIPYSLTN